MFADRRQAGQLLAKALADLAPLEPAPVVLALPRGGVPVGAEIARVLSAPLDLLMVRKIGVPGQEELAVGALAEGDPPALWFNPDILRLIGRKPADFTAEIAQATAENARRRSRYLGGRPPLDLAGRTAIVTDDGLATGATMRAALMALRAHGPASVILALPVAAPDSLAELAPLADRVVCLERPANFRAVGLYYRNFDQTGDAEVMALLNPAD